MLLFLFVDFRDPFCGAVPDCVIAAVAGAVHGDDKRFHPLHFHGPRGFQQLFFWPGTTLDLLYRRSCTARLSAPVSATNIHLPKLPRISGALEKKSLHATGKLFKCAFTPLINSPQSLTFWPAQPAALLGMFTRIRRNALPFQVRGKADTLPGKPLTVQRIVLHNKKRRL